MRKKDLNFFASLLIGGAFLSIANAIALAIGKLTLSVGEELVSALFFGLTAAIFATIAAIKK